MRICAFLWPSMHLVMRMYVGTLRDYLGGLAWYSQIA
ncbi:hypothetical protein IWX75_003092 [Arthrobacter sp. CAN_A6]